MPDQERYNEKELLRRLTLGEEPAFRCLFEQYKQKIYSFAFYLTHSEAMAEEVTQEIFIKIWTHRSQLHEIQYFNSWLKTLVRNQSYTLLRRLAVERRVLQEISCRMENQSREADNEILSREYDLLLKKAIEQLPPRQKEVYLLSRREGMKQVLIAKMMGLSIHTVKNHMKAAVRSIRVFLEAHKKAMLLILLYFFR